MIARPALLLGGAVAALAAQLPADPAQAAEYLQRQQIGLEELRHDPALASLPGIGGIVGFVTSETAFGVVYSQAITLGGSTTNTLMAQVLQSGITNVPSGAVTKAKVTVRGNINSCYIGHRASTGDAFDAESLTQVFFGGSASVSQGTTDETQSDEVLFAWDKTRDIILSFYCPTTWTYGSVTAGKANGYYKGSVDEAATADKTGYTLVSNQPYCLSDLDLNGF